MAAVRNVVAIQNLGRIFYKPALLAMQRILNEKLQFLKSPSGTEPLDTLLVLEHFPVYTIGTRTAEYIKTNEEERLKHLHAEFHVTNRGGLITFHGPGQLVCYPVLNLRRYRTSLRQYVNKLEEVVIRTCADFCLNAERTKDIGVWINDSKIAAIGVHASKGITTHGLAINCSTDLKWFDHIVPCGIKDKTVTSLTKEVERIVTVQDTLPIMLEKFQEVFDCDFVWENEHIYEGIC